LTDTTINHVFEAKSERISEGRAADQGNKEEILNGVWEMDHRKITIVIWKKQADYSAADSALESDSRAVVPLR
jgi:hypothetical protein